MIYLRDLKDDPRYPNPVEITETTKFTEPRIESNDVLAITLQTPAQSEGNTPISSNTKGAFDVLGGFLVDKDGNIELSLIGFVKVGGLTTSEAREAIKQKAREFYKDPVVNVRIANFDVTVLGDVGRPGIVTVPSEKANVFDVLALTGDLQLTGKRTNVLLVRSEGDKKTFARLDLTNTDIYKSPYFYVKQRDMLYVEPNRFKLSTSDNRLSRGLTIMTAAISLLSLLFIFKVIK
jgi:polysaccharide export outer membrane protein